MGNITTAVITAGKLPILHKFPAHYLFELRTSDTSVRENSDTQDQAKVWQCIRRLSHPGLAKPRMWRVGLANDGDVGRTIREKK